jgi:uncharacterized protein YecE (DUF72 family)
VSSPADSAVPASTPREDSAARGGASWPYSLGLPFWGFAEWVGNFYRPRSKPADFLGQYSSVFGTVEGNTTFYSLPSEETVAKWREATPPGFRFVFKFPRWVSHEGRLDGRLDEAHAFVERMAPLGDRLGPFLVQLPPAFGPERLPELDAFLARLPPGTEDAPLHYAVELRHADFFGPHQPGVVAPGPAGPGSEAGRRADELLYRHGCERCSMDTRPMRAGDTDHPDVTGARHKKPDLPAISVALHAHPMVRLVGHPEPEVNTPWIREWAERVAHWIRQGRHPFFMVHVPNNLHAPPLALTFHQALATALGPDVALPPLPDFPADRPTEPEGGQQLSLF